MKMKDQMMISDMPLAITLITLGFHLETIDRSDRVRYQFCFKRESKMNNLVQAYWSGELRLEPKLLFMNHKLLKSRLHSSI